MSRISVWKPLARKSGGLVVHSGSIGRYAVTASVRVESQNLLIVVGYDAYDGSFKDVFVSKGGNLSRANKYPGTFVARWGNADKTSVIVGFNGSNAVQGYYWVAEG